MIVSSCVIWATVLFTSYSMLFGVQAMWVRNVLLRGVILDKHLHGASICTAGLRTLAALPSYVSFVIKFFAIHQKMGPAPWRITCRQKLKIAKLNKVTEVEVSVLTSTTVDATGLAILKKPGSRGITIEGSKKKIYLMVRFHVYWHKWWREWSKLAVKNYLTAEYHHDTCNRYLRLGFVSSHIPWNAISNLELRLLFNGLRGALMLPSGSTLSNMCRREYSLTVDANKKQLPSSNKVSLGLDRWTSTNKLAITSVIAYSMDRKWAWGEAQLAFDKVDIVFFSYFEHELKITGQYVNTLEQD